LILPDPFRRPRAADFLLPILCASSANRWRRRNPPKAEKMNQISLSTVRMTPQLSSTDEALAKTVEEAQAANR
jgi:hypothetical protein